MLAGAVLAFAHTLGEFGVVLMVGGNLPGVTRTVSIAIYDSVQSTELRGEPIVTALLLLMCSPSPSSRSGVWREAPAARRRYERPEF